MNKILNIGIMAHVDAGKTTVTEGFLYHCGLKKMMGNVDRGTTTTDSMELEKERGMTIRAATVSFSIGDTKINLIDTPGHMDFIAEVERSLSVLDGVILVISAREGVQPQTRIIFQKLKKMGLPVIVFVNKIDRVGVELEPIFQQIREQLTKRVLIMQDVAIADDGCRVTNHVMNESAFAEEIAVLSERLLEKYLETGALAEAEGETVIRSRVNQNRLYPVYCGSALKDVGTAELMEAMVRWFRPRRPNSSQLSAYIYKAVCGDRGHILFYVRVFSGELKRRMRTRKITGEEEIVIRNLFGLEEGALVPKDQIEAGDVAVLMDMEALRCGDWLGQETRLLAAKQTEPLLHAVIHPVQPEKRRDLLDALRILTLEDPDLEVMIHEETDQIQLKLFGRLQQEILQALLAERFGLAAEWDELITVKKEKPARPVTCIVPINGPGNLLRAGVGLTLLPLDKGTGYQYETQVSFGDLTKSFQNGVKEGVEKGMRKGLRGEVVDTKVIFMASDYDSVTSTPADFRKLAERVVYLALQEAGTVLLEPVMRYVVRAPLCAERKVMTELVQVEARIEQSVHGQSELTIKGTVRLDRCKDFATHLLTLTEGQGIFETEFWQYRPVSAGSYGFTQ